MKYGNGFWSAVINGWSIVETEKGWLSYAVKGEQGCVSYLDIDEIRLHNGFIWDSLTIVASGQSTPRIFGLSASTAKELSADITHRVKSHIVGLLQNQKPALLEVMNRIQILMDEKRYLANADIRRWTRDIPNISATLANPFFSADDLPHELQTLIRPFMELIDPNSRKLKARNEAFVEWALDHYDGLFSKLEKYPLTGEQRRAAVVNEDRNLLIAAAGSGKSSTIVAKAAYLIESGLANASEILVLTYNKDAQTEIDERLNKLKGTVSNYKQSVKAKTFHSLGIETIAFVEGEKPSISELASAGKTRLAKLFTTLIEEIAARDPNFRADWLSYQALYKLPSADLGSIKSYREYEDYLRQLGATYASSPDGRRQLSLSTLDGHEVRSMEELRICNWLAINGIRYEYEHPYVFHTADVHHRQYHPDFYYPDVDLYHEHFALNARGEAPTIFRDYDAGVAWKRQIHQENNTKLIETHSAHIRDGSIFDRLKKELDRYGVSRNPLSEAQLDELVRREFDSDNDTVLFSTFLRHFKSNNATLEQVRQKSNENTDPARAAIFLNLFETVLLAYQNHLRNEKEIDFEDQIHMACDYLEAGKVRFQFKYILVDEFQDTSQDRKRMIHALIEQNEDTKLFAVGDDWQSIYRFTGVDIDIMTHFADHFGATSQSALTRTFRSYQGIVDVAAEFVQRNPNQITKTVHSEEKLDQKQIHIKGYETLEQEQEVLEKLLENIDSKALVNDAQVSVFVLARYNHLKPKGLAFYENQFPRLNIQFLTVHSAKGLEADYVIVLNLESGKFGFPSTITDDPLLHLVIPRPETFAHAEERRLLYVAITRAKRAVFLLANTTKTSAFATEIAEMHGVLDSAGLARSNPCPDCDTGALRLRTGARGEFFGCSKFPDCTYSQDATKSGSFQARDEENCPMCKSGKLRTRIGKNGAFLGCSHYPSCRFTRNT
jgi:DNA helicase IV